jgi:copper homeostasis protein (lipoprotein)
MTPMPALPRPWPWLLAALLAGCGQAPDGAGADAGPAVPGASLEFRGARPCADCRGIESSLRLEQAGTARRYRLVEVYLLDGRNDRYEESGTWSTRGDQLRLQPGAGAGGERWYLRLPDGRLQARGLDGAALPSLEGDVMTPVTLRTDR